MEPPLVKGIGGGSVRKVGPPQINIQLTETASQASHNIFSVELGKSSRAKRIVCTPLLAGFFVNSGRETVSTGWPSVYRPPAHYAIMDAGGSRDVVLAMKNCADVM